MSEFAQALSDTGTITWRNVTRLSRQPDSIVFGIIQSVMFVLLFAFVFGGAIAVPGRRGLHRVPDGRIFVQTVAFTCATTCIAMADDLSRGRVRPVPLAADVAFGGAGRADVRGPRVRGGDHRQPWR